MKKILSIFKYALFAISIIALILVFTMSEPEYKGVEIILNWAYVLVGIAILSVIVFPLINLAQNPKAAMRSLIGLGVMILVIGVSYAMSSDAPIVTSVATYDSPFELKFTDTGLYTAYFALAAALVITVVGEIRNSFK